MSRVVVESEKRITQHYGNNGHKGVDIGWRTDESQNKVYANCKGVVVETVDGLGNLPNSKGTTKSWGNYVLIKHENGIYSRYAHLQKGLPVKKGDIVDENTVIGIMGNSGHSLGRHLHFEVATGYNSNTRINSESYLTKSILEEKNLVSELQEVLNKQYNCKLAVDGKFGPLTTEACRKNQLYKGKKALIHIKWLQTRLVTLGYSCGKFGIDGLFGIDTLNALKNFQKNNNLKIDGYVGVDTSKKLVNKS